MANQLRHPDQTDYANCGDANNNEYFAGPTTVAQGLSSSFTWHNTVADGLTGVSTNAAWVRMANITDGPSNTYMFGRESGSLPRLQRPTAGLPRADIKTMNTAAPLGLTPSKTPGVDAGMQFRQALQPGSCSAMARSTISFFIDLETHRRLCNRQDGMALDASKY